MPDQPQSLFEYSNGDTLASELTTSSNCSYLLQDRKAYRVETLMGKASPQVRLDKMLMKTATLSSSLQHSRAEHDELLGRPISRR